MQVIPQIIFRDIPDSEAIRAAVNKNLQRLERFFPRIIGCHAVIEAPHRHQHKGKVYHVNLHIAVPGKEIVVNHGRERDGVHEDLYVAIRDTFAAAARKLQDHARERRDAGKQKERITAADVA